MTSTEPRRSLRWIGAVIAVVAAALLATGSELPDPDIWWNLVDGEAFLDEGRAPPLELWGAHGCLDAREHDHRLGSSAWALAWRAGGMWGLVALRAALVALAGLAVAWALRRGPILVAMAWAIGLVGALAFRASARPELVGLALLAWCVALSVDVVAREGRSAPRLVALAALQLLAVFSHATFLLAPIATGGLLAATLVDELACSRRIGAASRRAALALAAVSTPLLARPSALSLLVVAGEERAIAAALGFAEYRPFVDMVRGGFVPPSLACIAVLVGAPAICLAARPAPSGRPRAEALVALGTIAPFVVVAASMMRGLAPLAVVAAVAGGAVVARNVERRGPLAALLMAITVAVVGTRVIDDPALAGRRPPDLAPTRLTPLHASRFLVESGSRGLVYAPLHLGNWLLHEGAAHPGALRVVWSGRRTYSLSCGQELLAGRRGGADFVKVDDRLKPDAVLVMHATEPGLVRTLVERGWSLAHLDLRNAVYLRHAAGPPSTTAEALVAGENRDLEPALLAGLLGSACSVLTLSNADGPGRADVCAAAASLEHHVGLTPSSTRR